MRILFFAHAFLPIVGGAERFLDRLARELAQRGHAVCVLAARVRGADNRVDAPYRLIRYQKPFSKRLLPRHTVFYLLRAHVTHRPQLVHAHGAYPAAYSAVAYRHIARVPIVVRPIGAEILPGERIQEDAKLRRRIQRSLVSARGVVAQSRELEELILALGVPSERVRRIPNGVDLDGAPMARPGKVGPVVAAMGLFYRKKGFDVLIEAFRELHKSIPQARLVIAGEGHENENLRAQVRAAGLDDAIELPGLLDERGKRELFERASVFVSSSRREPFSNANLEALGAGLPLVATAVGGNREIVEDGTNGYLVPSEDAPSLAAALERVLGDAELRERMGAASREKARKYEWRTIVDRYESFYEELIEAAG